MLNADQLEHAIAIQNRCFKLLQWLGKAVQSGFVSASKARHVADTSLAARDWVSTHYQNLPLDCRPAPEDLEPFANFFGTYLETSFDLVAQPQNDYASDDGCYCPLCRRLADPRHLRPKSLGHADKERAMKLRVRRMEMLAREEGLPSYELLIKASLEDQEVKHFASYAAYGSALLDRLKGISGERAVLALWRDFAWTRNGSPDPNFKLNVSAILKAEQSLLQILHQHLEQDSKI